jgi:hypothetical protein
MIHQISPAAAVWRPARLAKQLALRLAEISVISASAVDRDLFFRD